MKTLDRCLWLFFQKSWQFIKDFVKALAWALLITFALYGFIRFAQDQQNKEEVKPIYINLK